MYTAAKDRYSVTEYRRAGISGLLLPPLSLGLWHNFDEAQPIEKCKEMIFSAFDKGITHFDLANNYGPPPGSAEKVFGKILASDLAPYRDEIVVSSKAGHPMWEGPYGDWGSRKSIISSCDQSLKRMGLEYVDIFYSHRHDPNTPLEESMMALDQLVRSGKALYIGLSKYPADKLSESIAILRELRTPILLHQIRYSMLVRQPEVDIFDEQRKNGIGCVTFSPLAQGQLSAKYLDGIPEGSRASKNGFLKSDDVQKSIDKVRALNNIALERGQSLSQMAIAWQLRNSDITSVIVGVSSTKQLLENLEAVKNITFSSDELAAIDRITH